MPRIRYRWIDKKSQLNVGALFFKAGELMPHVQLAQSRLDFFVNVSKQAKREEIPLPEEMPPKPAPEPEPEPEQPKRPSVRQKGKKKGKRNA